MSLVNPLTAPATDDAVEAALLGDLIENQEDLDSRLGVVEGSLLPNGSFETDDGAGTPSNWTVTDGTGGSHAILAAVVAHGAQALQFTRTLGAGNSGGYADSPLVPVSQGGYHLSGWYTADAAVESTAQILWYDEDQTYISTTTYLTFTIETSWRPFVASLANAPAGARFARVRVNGATATTNLAAVVAFDGLEIYRDDYDTDTLNGTTHALTATSWTTLETLVVYIPDDATTLGITIDVSAASDTCYARIQSGAVNGTTETFATVATYTRELVLDVTTLRGTRATINIQAYTDYASGGSSTLTTTSDESDGWEQKVRLR